MIRMFYRFLVAFDALFWLRERLILFIFDFPCDYVFASRADVGDLDAVDELGLMASVV